MAAPTLSSRELPSPSRSIVRFSSLPRPDLLAADRSPTAGLSLGNAHLLAPRDDDKDDNDDEHASSSTSTITASALTTTIASASSHSPHPPTQRPEVNAAPAQPGRRLSRSAEIGVVVGSIGFFSILLLLAVFWYRRRKRLSKSRLSSMSLEKSSTPGSLPQDRDDLFGPIRSNQASGDEQPLSPKQKARDLNPDDMDIYPPGQYPLDRFRFSSAPPSIVSDATAETWHTWKVDQKQASPKKRWM